MKLYKYVYKKFVLVNDTNRNKDNPFIFENHSFRKKKLPIHLIKQSKMKNEQHNVIWSVTKITLLPGKIDKNECKLLMKPE